MASEFNWIDSDFQNYGVVQLDESDPPDDSLTLKKIPEIPLVPSKITIKEAFQVDTSQVLLRLKKALWPLKSENFFENSQIDLYSPFWITTTLVLVISANSVLQNHSMKILVSSAMLFYSVALVVPMILYCLLSNSGSALELYAIVAIYGYSLVHFIFPAVLAIFVGNFLRWAIWTLAAGLSLLFLYKNLSEEIKKVLAGQSTIAIGVIVGGHLCLVISGNLWFLSSN